MNELTDAQWAEPCLKHNREKEVEWSGLGYSFAWIDPEPAWCTASDWHQLFNENYELAFPDPTTPCTRILRFSLLGGGQIRAMERFKASSLEAPDHPVWCPKIDLRITAHYPDGHIAMATGEKHQGAYFEMNAQAVVLSRGHQDIADRAAATFRLIDDEADNFFALLDGSAGCAICGRTLRDEISKLIGVGSTCASQYRIPHNKAAAERRLVLRHKLLE